MLSKFHKIHEKEKLLSWCTATFPLEFPTSSGLVWYRPPSRAMLLGKKQDWTGKTAQATATLSLQAWMYLYVQIWAYLCKFGIRAKYQVLRFPWDGDNRLINCIVADCQETYFLCFQWLSYYEQIYITVESHWSSTSVLPIVRHYLATPIPPLPTPPHAEPRQTSNKDYFLFFIL